MSDAQFEKFQKIAVDVLKVDAAKVTMDAKFGEDLDADSLDLVELVMALEDEFGVEIPESELDGIDTVGAAFNIVTAKL
jgi:acyl carrier protein